MPNCLQNLDASGHTGDDVRSFRVPETPIAVCPGAFLIAATVDSCREYNLVSSTTWNSSLLQTQKDAKTAFEGVALS
jgi:hypothetical protein